MGANSAVLVPKFEQLGGVQQQLLRVRRVCVFLCADWGGWVCEMTMMEWMAARVGGVMKTKEWMTACGGKHHIHFTI